MMSAPLQAVVFDLDGVITDTARFHFIAWAELAQALGVPFDEEFNESLKGVDRMGSLDRILARASRHYGPDERQVLAERKNLRYQRLIASMTADHLLPGARDTLQAVRRAGLKTALASASRNAAAILLRLGIQDLFDVVVDANLIERGKPDPEIFLCAASQLNVRCAACLGVEDSVAGLRAIRAAGMRSLGIGDPQVLREADDVIPSLAAFDVERYLRPA